MVLALHNFSHLLTYFDTYTLTHLLTAPDPHRAAIAVMVVAMELLEQDTIRCLARQVHTAGAATAYSSARTVNLL